MQVFFRKILGLLALFLLTSGSWTQVPPINIDSLVSVAMEQFNVAGVSVGVVKDGKVIHAKGYGNKKEGPGQEVSEHTLFAIASNTKAFTTTALAMLVEEGKLRWTDKVIDHIPEFRMYNPYVTQNFNIQDLLTHRSGLGLGAGDLMFWPSGTDFTMDDLLSVFQHFEPVSAFRTQFDYDNVLYFIAGEVIKRVSGMPWERFVEQRIFEPLNMDHTYSTLSYIDDQRDLATPHLSKPNGDLVPLEHDDFDPEKINGAAGSIYSNADDLCNWMLVQLNEGRYGEDLNKHLFSEDSQREMWKIHTSYDVYPDPRYRTHFAGYGLGWDLKDVVGNMEVSHTGGLAGMLSRTVLIPDQELGVVVLTNTWMDGAGVFASVSKTIVDHYLGLEPFDWVTEYRNRLSAGNAYSDSVVAEVWKTVAAADDSHINVDDYTGFYRDPWFGTVEIYQEGNQLWFRAERSPKLTGPLAYYKAQAFAIRWETPDMECDAFAIFSLDKDGKAERIRMEGIAPNIDFSFDFQDLDLKRIED